MQKVILSVVLVLVIIYMVPFLIYSLASTTIDLKPPEGASPLQFLMGVFVSKVGTSIAFVLIFYLGRNSWSGQWLLYALFCFGHRLEF
jgi:hypothetical protein